MLAIGIVVDDAIVVVEAVHSKMERTKLGAREATVQSMNEISGVIISITLVMAAVFVPVGFMQGPAGVFYKQFAFTLVTAILISAVNALTLSPALCALFLKNTHAEEAHGKKLSFGQRFFHGFNAGFKATTEKYTRTVNFLIHRKWISITALLLIIAVTTWLIQKSPTGFIPTEDQGFIVYSVNLPPGASLDRTQTVMKRVDSLLHEVPAIDKRGAVTGLNFVANANSSNYAVGFIRMKAPGERGEVKSVEGVMGIDQPKT